MPRDRDHPFAATASRRGFVAGAAGLVLAAASGPVGAALVATPRQTPGPFYPQRFPADGDNDLATVAGAPGPAKGTIAHVGGRVLDAEGRALAGVRVEIWQCNAFGNYHHSWDWGQKDPGFQGWGATTTAADGGYRFRTIRPVAYGSRPPHIHYALSGPGFSRLTTQMYVAGEPRNESDGILGRVRDPARRARLIVPFSPAPAVEPGAFRARFDIVLGHDLFGG